MFILELKGMRIVIRKKHTTDSSCSCISKVSLKFKAHSTNYELPTKHKGLSSQKNSKTKGWGFRSVEEHLPSVYEVLALIPQNKK